MSQVRELIKKHLDLLKEERERWDLEKLLDITSKYNNLTDFLKNERKAADVLRRRGLYDELTSHMTRSNRSYTDDEIKDEAKKYSSQSEFAIGSPLVYQAMKRRPKLRDEIRQFLPISIVKWTDEMLDNEARKYSTIKDFRTNSESAYVTASSRGILDRITAHMDRPKIWTYQEAEDEAKKYKDFRDFSLNSPAFSVSKRMGWTEDFKKFLPYRIINWTKELASIEASKYQTKSDFKKGSPKAYSAAYNNGWLDDITKHMKPLGNRKNRLVYAYEFPDNHVYVGLTYNKKKREEGHFDLDNPRSQIARHILKTKLTPEYKELSSFMSENEAANLENCTIENYRSQGWIILNKQKGGNLGGCQRTTWTMEKIRDLAKSYKGRSDFKNHHKNVYQIAQKYGWLDDVFKGVPYVDNTKWTYEKTKEFAKNFESRSQMKYDSQSAYHRARKEGWLDEFFPVK